jgi:hypothetical protein
MIELPEEVSSILCNFPNQSLQNKFDQIFFHLSVKQNQYSKLEPCKFVTYQELHFVIIQREEHPNFKFQNLHFSTVITNLQFYKY